MGGESERNKGKIVSEEMLKDKIIIRALNKTGSPYSPSLPRNFSTVFRVLDMKTGLVSILPHTLLDCGSIGSMEVVGSVIYIIGSQMYDRSSYICYSNQTEIQLNKHEMHQWSSYLDLSKPEIGWNKFPRMSIDNDLFGPDSVSFCGKIYVFTGLFHSFICEVYDPDISKWSRIKSPPVPPVDDEELVLEVTSPVLADPSNNRILVCFNDISTMYAYYPSDDRWECVVEDFRGWCKRDEPVVCADGVIYVHYRKKKGLFRAFHVATKQWLNVRASPDSDFQSFIQLYEYCGLFYRGNGLLFLIGFSSKDTDPLEEHTERFIAVVHVVEIKVQLQNEPLEVLVTPVSCRCYPLDSFCHIIQHLAI